MGTSRQQEALLLESLGQLEEHWREKLEDHLSNVYDDTVDEESTSRHKVLERVLKHIEQDYAEKKYGFFYDDKFKENFKPFTVAGKLERREDILIGARSKTTFDQLELKARRTLTSNLYHDHVIFYLHYPNRARKEIISFDTTDVARGFISLRGYSDVCYTHDGHVRQQSHTADLRYRDGQRVMTGGAIKAYRIGHIPSVPNSLFCSRNKHLRMKLVKAQGFSPILVSKYVKILPVDDSSLRILPYWIFFLYLSLKYQKATTEKELNALLSPKKNPTLSLPSLLKIFKMRDFSFEDVGFFNFLFSELVCVLSNIEYGDSECYPTWNDIDSFSDEERKEIYSALKKMDEYDCVNLLVKNIANPKMMQTFNHARFGPQPEPCDEEDRSRPSFFPRDYDENIKYYFSKEDITLNPFNLLPRCTP